MAAEFQKLCEDAERNDATAIERLEREYGHHLRRVAARHIKALGIEAEVEPDDLVDSAYRILLLQPSRLEGMTALQIVAYMQRVLHHRAVSKTRWLHRRKRDIKRHCATRVESLASRVRELAAETSIEFEELLDEAYNKVPVMERQVCVFRLAGYSWEEVGRRLKLTPEAARKRFDRAQAVVLRGLSASCG